MNDIRQTLSDEQIERYLRIGLEADVKERAKELDQAMADTKTALTQAAGIYQLKHLQSFLDGLRTAADRLQQALATKEGAR